MKFKLLWSCILLSFLWQEITAPNSNTDTDEIEDLDTNGMHPPLVFFYYAATRHHSFTDVDIAQKADFTSTHTEKPTHIIILCPDPANENVYLIKKIYHSVKSINEHLKCQRSFEPLMIHSIDDQSNSYSIGYQIRINLSKWKRGKNFLQHYNNDGETFWIPYIAIVFDQHYRRLYTAHSILALMHSEDYSKECTYFPVKSDSINRIEIEEFYTIEKQKTLFAELNIQVSPHGYFIMHKLIPIQDFHRNNATSGACTYLNTVPIRESVAQGSLRKVEELLRKVADIIGKITIYTGTYGTINRKETRLNLDISITSIPQIIWKVVLHTITTTNGYQYSYLFLIVVHNQPTVEIEEKLCDKGTCQQYGWNLNDDDTVDIGLIRCCIFDETTTRKIDIPLPLHYETLNLNHVPMQIDEKGYTISHLNVAESMKEPPLVLLYDKRTNEYTFTDVQSLKIPSTSPYALQPSHIAFFCPADANKELDFQRWSKKENVYFVRNVFTEIKSITEFPKCANTLKTSTIKIGGKYKYIHTYSTGYLIAKNNDLVMNYDNFLKNYQPQDAFVYILPYMEVTFDTSTIKPLHSIHSIRAGMHSNDYSQRCYRFQSGTDELSKIDIDTIYSLDKQNELFQSFGISPPPSYGYFVMQLLTPIQDFNGVNSTQGVCSYMNITPLWQAVAEGPVRKVEQFIRKVADVIGKINVITAPYGNLILRKINSDDIMEVYLSDDQIPVSKIFFKLVQHQVTLSENHINLYIMLIVIHNEPTSEIEKKDRICPESICHKYGWNIEDSNADIGLTYCCEITTEIMENLSISLIFPPNPLNLFNVPMKINHRNEITDKIDVARAFQKSPLILLYYADQTPNTFQISDFETLKKLRDTPITEVMPFHILFCCPAAYEDERNIETFYKEDNIFFVRNIIKSFETIITDFKCDRHFGPSIRKNDSENYEIGYKVQLAPGLLSAEQYDSIVFDTIISWKDVYWLPYATIKFNPQQLKTKSTIHTIYARSHTDDYSEKCTDFQFASDQLGGINLADFYTEESQNGIFENLNLPIPFPYGHFAMHQLIPLQDYKSEDTKSGICTYLNTTPILQSVSEGPLRQIEIFIRKIADIIGKVIVETGTYGTYTVTYRNTNQPLYLDPYSNPTKIPVPGTLWKLVSHWVLVGSRIHEYALLIAISNGPQPSEIIDQDSCSWEICLENGWNLGVTNSKLASIYCCQMNQRVATILDLKVQTIVYPLNLKNDLPLEINEKGETVKHINVMKSLQTYDESN